MSCGGYNLELETNAEKKRIGIYIRSDIKYIRLNELETPNCHILVIDVVTSIKLCIIRIYRSFRPPGNVSPDVFFKIQLGLLRNALTNNCYILGDFNLDANMENRLDYNRRVPMNYLTEFAFEFNLSQIITFNTWSRILFILILSFLCNE